MKTQRSAAVCRAIRRCAVPLMLALAGLSLSARTVSVKSPSGRLQCTLLIDGAIRFAVKLDGRTVIAPSVIALNTDTAVVPGIRPALQRVNSRRVKETIDFVVPRKFRSLPAEYTMKLLEFGGGYGLEVRAYDEGIAYRWITGFAGDVTVKGETANFLFAEDCRVWFPEEESMHSHQERAYLSLKLSEIGPGRFSTPAALFELASCRVMIVESGLRGYPGMYLESNGANGFRGKFPGVPLETVQTRDRDVKVVRYADYIARTAGKRAFPWRALIIAETDAQLLLNELVFKLADPLEIADPSWIRPGKVAWDWWNANNIRGVDFPAGINTATYRHYIDFAAEHGLEYIILDEGWYHLEDVLKVNEEMDVRGIIRYGREKNVGVILWVTWKALDDQLDRALDEFAAWGAAGVKVDFMQRDDQWMVDYYWRVAAKAAARRLLVDFHGAFKPAGIRRAFPNVITQEGVLGLEHCKWSEAANPGHDAILPFSRMVLGPMDYTPGAMRNANRKNFRAVFGEPMSAGTRCHQLALYVVFESPLQMLADSPSNYRREPECMEFLSRVPAVWERTVPLAAKAGEYVALAREGGDQWYVGAISDWEPRRLELALDFLPEGDYTLTAWQDGVNAAACASDYKKRIQAVDRRTRLAVELASGGGWAGIIEKK